ncbi:MAG: AMP-binding protein [Gemmatimonadaceae bacterium]
MTAAEDAGRSAETDANIAARLIARAALHPDRTAIIEHRGGRATRVSFARLAERVATVGASLRAYGVERGDRVLILVPMSAELYAVLLGVLHAGATAVFVDAWADRKRLDAAVGAAAPKAFVGTWKAQLLRIVSPALRGVPRHFVAGAGALRSASPGAPARSAPDDPALITFTTGSTGAPKAAVRTHAFLWAQHEALAAHLKLRDDDIDMPTLPIFVLNNLALGVPSVIPDFDPRRPAEIDPARVWAQMVSERVSTTSGSPAFYERLVGYAERQGMQIPVRALFTGGAPVLPPLARRLSERVAGEAHVVYGSTEAEPISGIEMRALLEASDSRADSSVPAVTIDRSGICVGHPVPQVDVRIIRVSDGVIDLPPSGVRALELPRGETGEIVVSGAHVLRGYLNDPAAERAAKLREGDRVWHRTGDGGRIDVEGRLWLMGRVRERVRREDTVWWGLPAETRALAHTSVRHAAYLGDGEPGHQRAVLVVESERALDPSFRAELVALVAPHPVDELRAVPAIPRDPRHASKTDTEALRALLRG